MKRFILLALLFVAAPTLAADLAVAKTKHSGVFNGVQLNYTAIVSETLIPGADGAPAAKMVTTAYVRDGIKDRSKRPVMFAFNGGPGASSSPLHTRAIGVKLTVGEGEARYLDHNPYSPIDVVDLVFIDPIGTGLSRPLPGVDGQQFWGVKGDAESVKAFIQSWLKANNREGSPIYICGESYGTVRAAQLAYIAKDLDIKGVILVSLVGGRDGPEITQVSTFPTFAVTAVYHGVVDGGGRPVPEIFADAAKFARTDYIGALIQGTALPADEKARVAQEMSRRIGLPADFIAEKNLRLSLEDFMLNLLKDKGVRTGQLDTRATGAFTEYNSRRPPYNDPGLGAGGSAPHKGLGPPKRAPKPNANLLDDYLKLDLKFPSPETYNGLNLDINAKWKWDEEAARNVGARMGQAMKEQPNLRLLWTGGYYDLSTTVFNAQYAIYTGGVPPERTTAALFVSGHEVYGGQDLVTFTVAVRAFVTGK